MKSEKNETIDTLKTFATIFVVVVHSYNIFDCAQIKLNRVK